MVERICRVRTFSKDSSGAGRTIGPILYTCESGELLVIIIDEEFAGVKDGNGDIGSPMSWSFVSLDLIPTKVSTLILFLLFENGKLCGRGTA